MKINYELFLCIALIYFLSAFVNLDISVADKITGLSFSQPKVISGDVPHYLVDVYSLVYDGDFDLSNNYYRAEHNGSCDAGFYNKNKEINHAVKFVDKKTCKVYGGKFKPDVSGRVWIKIPDGPSNNPVDYYYYSVHPPGLPLFLSFFLWPLKYFTTPANCSLEAGSIFISLIVSIVGLVFFYKLLSLYCKDRFTCSLTVVIFSFATPLWHYSRTMWPETFLVSFLIVSIYLLVSRKYGAIAGLLIALCVLIKFPFVLICGVCAVYLIAQKRYKAAAFYLLPVLFVGVLILAYNHFIFGSALSTGQTYYFSKWGNPLVGFFGMLFSPSQGLFLFSPVLLFSLFGIKKFHKSNKKDFFLFASIFILYHAFWAIRGRDWEGGGFSNRYLVPVFPLFGVPFALFYSADWIKVDKLIRWIFYFVLVYSIIINANAGIFPALMWAQNVWQPVYVVVTKLSRILLIVKGAV